MKHPWRNAWTYTDTRLSSLKNWNPGSLQRDFNRKVSLQSISWNSRIIPKDEPDLKLVLFFESGRFRLAVGCRQISSFETNLPHHFGQGWISWQICQEKKQTILRVTSQNTFSKYWETNKWHLQKKHADLFSTKKLPLRDAPTLTLPRSLAKVSTAPTLTPPSCTAVGKVQSSAANQVLLRVLAGDDHCYGQFMFI